MSQPCTLNGSGPARALGGVGHQGGGNYVQTPEAGPSRGFENSKKAVTVKPFTPLHLAPWSLCPRSQMPILRLGR